MNVIPSTVSWGFNASDLFSNSVALYSTVGAFILLGLAIPFAGRLVHFIKGVVNGTGYQGPGSKVNDTIYISADKETWHYHSTDYKRGRDWYVTKNRRGDITGWEHHRNLNRAQENRTSVYG